MDQIWYNDLQEQSINKSTREKMPSNGQHCKNMHRFFTYSNYLTAAKLGHVFQEEFQLNKYASGLFFFLSLVPYSVGLFHHTAKLDINIKPVGSSCGGQKHTHTEGDFCQQNAFTRLCSIIMGLVLIVFDWPYWSTTLKSF